MIFIILQNIIISLKTFAISIRSQSSGRVWEAGDGRQGTGGRVREAGYGRQGTGGRAREAADETWRIPNEGVRM